jgi:hypothetical protein
MQSKGSVGFEIGVDVAAEASFAAFGVFPEVTKNDLWEVRSTLDLRLVFLESISNTVWYAVRKSLTQEVEHGPG